jgi:single-strand selective monofunctional uracil DNA glycosylase
MSDSSEQLIAAAQALRDDVDRLSFKGAAAYVYNPLAYAWDAHREYLTRYGSAPKKVLLMGMNPGPFGMAQTGVPFGEIAAVRDWMKIDLPVGKPPLEHPKRIIEGFACAKSEVSGRRLWGLFTERFGTARRFFKDHFVVNYCPLVFMEDSGRNLTPDKLPASAARRLFAACDEHLRRVVEILGPQHVIGVGGFALKRINETFPNSPFRTGTILHPSPASPAANKDWSGKATAQLTALGIWK